MSFRTELFVFPLFFFFPARDETGRELRAGGATEKVGAVFISVHRESSSISSSSASTSILFLPTHLSFFPAFIKKTFPIVFNSSHKKGNCRKTLFGRKKMEMEPMSGKAWKRENERTTRAQDHGDLIDRDPIFCCQSIASPSIRVPIKRPPRVFKGIS